jgi:hypothetical protein
VTFVHEISIGGENDTGHLYLDGARVPRAHLGGAAVAGESPPEAALQPEHQEEEMIRVKVIQERVSLAFRTQEHEWYTATEDPDGTIHLVPFAGARVKLHALPDPDLERTGS